MKPYRSKRSQAGEGELMVFGIVVVICCLISGSLAVLGWVRDSKDGKLEARRLAKLNKQNQEKVVISKDPDAYFVSCKKSLWNVLGNNVTCDVLPESYGELEFMTYDYE